MDGPSGGCLSDPDRRQMKIRSHSGTIALKTGDFLVKKIGRFSKTQRKGFTKTIPWAENPGKIRRTHFRVLLKRPIFLLKFSVLRARVLKRLPRKVSRWGSHDQKNSRRLELSISKNTPHGRWGQGPGSVDPSFRAVAFPGARNPRICSISFGNFSRDFPAEQTPETATAFPSLLVLVSWYCCKRVAYMTPLICTTIATLGAWYRSQKPLKPENTRKLRKKYKTPLPGLGSENTKNITPKNTKMVILGHFGIFFGIFFVFSGPNPRRGVLHFFRIFFVFFGLQGFL